MPKDEPESPVSEFEQQVLGELKSLREHIDLLHHHQSRYVVQRHHWLGHVIHSLEYDPKVQWRVHIVAAWFWIANLIVVSWAQFLFHEQWDQIAVFYIAVVSLYANFATEYGAASAAMAAMGTHPLPEIPTEPAHPPWIESEEEPDQNAAQSSR